MGIDGVCLFMRKNKRFLQALLIISIIFLLIAVTQIIGLYFHRDDDTGFVHGTAETIEGKTIVVSMFVSDGNYSWDQTNSDDLSTISNVKKYLSIAADYMEDTASSYGVEAEFVTDFDENTDLIYYFTTQTDMEGETNIDDTVWTYIENNISTTDLMEKYNADNVVFLAVMNTDEKSSAITCTRNWYEGMPYPYEIVYLYNYDYGEINPPAVYAHEIYHAFGAPDLYAVDESFGIDSDDLEYFQNNLSNDIMLTCSDQSTGAYLYDKISNETSELTAYYIGLTSSSTTKDTLGLSDSEHVTID